MVRVATTGAAFRIFATLASKDRAHRVNIPAGRQRTLFFSLLFAAAWLCSPIPYAGAVPVPYKNCGKAGDILSVQKVDASVWPPPTAAPLVATATLDPVTGELTNLHVLLFLGVNWTFDSGILPTSRSEGFVTLPASVPMSLTSLPLPVAAGPYNSFHTFVANDGSGASVTVASQATVGQSIAAPLTNLSLTFNGTPGFPLPPVPGSYEARVQMTLASGPEAFCVDLTLTDVAFVTGATSSQVPTLSAYGLYALLFFVGGLGFLALLRQAR